MNDLTTPRPWDYFADAEGVRVTHKETGNTICRMGDPTLDDECPVSVDLADAALIVHAVNGRRAIALKLQELEKYLLDAEEETGVVLEGGREMVKALQSAVIGTFPVAERYQ